MLVRNLFHVVLLCMSKHATRGQTASRKPLSSSYANSTSFIVWFLTELNLKKKPSPV